MAIKKVLKYSIPTINDGHEDFIKLIDLNRKLISASTYYLPKDYDFLFTFEGCQFLRQNAIAYLGAVSTYLKELGFSVMYSFSTMKKSIFEMLQKDGFLSSNFGKNFSESSDVSADSIKFTGFRGNIKEDEQLSLEIVDYIRNEWLKDSNISVAPKLKSDLSAKMYELFANALEHSNSKIGCFVCGQIYDEDHEIVLTVVDLGIGIVQSVKNFLYQRNRIIDSRNAIKWALEPGNTTRSDDSGGLGLSLIYDFLNINNGIMDIYCNDVFLRVDQGELKVKSLETDFTGTMINIRMRKKNVRYGYKSEFGE